MGWVSHETPKGESEHLPGQRAEALYQFFLIKWLISASGSPQARNNLALMNQGRDRNPFRLIARHAEQILIIHSIDSRIRVAKVPERRPVATLSGLPMAQSNYNTVAKTGSYPKDTYPQRTPT
jgi:hypothetical protein